MSITGFRSVAMAVFVLAGTTTTGAADEATSTVEKCSKGTSKNSPNYDYVESTHK